MNKTIKLPQTVSPPEVNRLRGGATLKKALLLVGMSVLVFQSPAISGGDTPSPYANVFKEDIYDQSNLKFTTKHLKPESRQNEKLNKKILQQLFLKKISFLEHILFTTCDRELNDLKLLIENHQPSNAGKVLSIIGKTFATASSFALLGVIPGAGPALVGTRAIVGGTAAISAAGSVMTGLHDFLQPDGQVDLEKMKVALERKKKDLIEGLHKEPIADLEIAYVLRKRFYTSPEIKKQIESALLMTRLGGGLPLDFSIAFLENCLKLPFQKKQINPDTPLLFLDNHSNSNLLIPQGQARETLMSYHQDTKKELQKIIMQIACTSNSEATSYRRFYYFWGEPGLGKSTAARALATFLGLPHYEMNIRTAADISQSSLEGGDWQRQMATPGHIAHCLLEGIGNENNEYEDIKVPIHRASKYFLPQDLSIRTAKKTAKNTYKNSVFIINDFDRLLLDPSTSTQVLAFLLDYLDPEKKSFFSPYFQAPIDTNNLLVFMTGNSRIPKDKIFEALRDRCIEVEFAAFENDAREKILSSFIDEMGPAYHLRTNTQLRAELLNSAKDIRSLRSAKTHIEEKMIEKMILNIPKKNKLDVEDEHSSSEDHSDEDRILANASGDEDISFDSSSELDNSEESMIFSAYPPTFQNPNVLKQAKSLDKISTVTRQLYSEDQSEQLKGLIELLGEYRNFPYLNASGQIESLWKTISRKTYEEGEDNLGALANRLKRFETPQERQEIMQMHLGLVQSITDALLNFKEKDPQDEDFIYKKIINDNVKLNNINVLANHLYLIGKITDTCEGEKLGKESKRLLRGYGSWLGNIGNKKWKVDLLLARYKLPTFVNYDDSIMTEAPDSHVLVPFELLSSPNSKEDALTKNKKQKKLVKQPKESSKIQPERNKNKLTTSSTDHSEKERQIDKSQQGTI